MLRLNRLLTEQSVESADWNREDRRLPNKVLVTILMYQSGLPLFVRWLVCRWQPVEQNMGHVRGV